IPTYNHLWFVAYLWVYTVLLYALVRFAPALLSGLRRAAEWSMAGVGVLLIPMVYLALTRAFVATRFPVTDMLINDWYNHANFFAIFLGGFTLAATQAPWAALERMRWHSLGLAVLSWAVLCGSMGAYNYEAWRPSQLTFALLHANYGCLQW